MTNSQQSAIRIGFSAGGTLLAASILLNATAPAVTVYAKQRAVSVADVTNRGVVDSVMGYRAAMALDPDNIEYRQRLADAEIASWKPQAALDTLPTNSADPAVQLSSAKALLELNRAADAVQAAPNGSSGATVKGLAMAAQKQRSGIDELIKKDDSLTDTQRKSLERARGGGVPLAQELAANGMPQAALRVLEPLSGPSAARSILMAQLVLSDPNMPSKGLKTAQNALIEAIKVDPSNVGLHEQLQAVDEVLGQQDEAKHQAEIANRLKSGRF
jgi:hypothetical protein